MHPVLASRARLGAYYLAWAPGVVLLSAQLSGKGWPTGPAIVLAVSACLLASALFLSSWYLCQVLPLRESRTATLLGTWTAAAFAMGTLWAGGTWLLFRLLSGLSLLEGMSFSRSMVMTFAGTGAVFYIIVVTYHYLIISQERAHEAERAESELREQARDAELKALRAQLNPHFLFNSLNSISALTSLDPKGARRMYVLLAEFLRKSLKLGERPLVTLAEELDLLRAYLSIEQIRFGARLRVEWAVDPAVETCEIPTLLMQPLVENAIKHGIANLPEGGSLRIAAVRKGESLEIQLENGMDGEAPVPVGLGMGLAQVKHRLRGRYGAAVHFETGAREGVFRVTLRFPMRQGGQDHE